MTIQEAIKSGKPFKRPDGKTLHELFYTISVPSGGYVVEIDLVYGGGLRAQFYLSCTLFRFEDILADDWEVKP